MTRKRWILGLVLLAIGMGITPQETVHLRFVSPTPDEIWVGRRDIQVQVENIAAENIRSIELYLNGQLLREWKNPPYTMSFDFGMKPRNILLKALLKTRDGHTSAAEIRSYHVDDATEVDVTQIVIPVVVTDDRGNYIYNLQQQDFVVLEDGVPKEISYFARSGRTQFHMVLLIDISSSMKDKIAQVKDAAKSFLEELLGNGSQAAAMFFNHDVFEDADFTADTNELVNAISMALPFGATALYDAIDYSIKMVRGIPGQNIIIVFSDGEDNSSYIDPFTLIKKAEHSNTNIYSIGNSRSSDTRYQDLLEKISTSSGGITFFIDDPYQIRKIYDQIRRDIQAQYILQVLPKRSAGANKRFRKVTVQVKNHRSYQVRTVKGYYY